MAQGFNFGDTGFDDNDELFLTSSGTLANQRQCVRLSALSSRILDDSYPEMERFSGSLGNFFTPRYRAALSGSGFADISPSLANQMLDYTHKGTNTVFASPTWFDVSARLNAQSEATSGNQFLTWRTMGFKTVFDYIQKKLPDPRKNLDVESKVQLNKEVTNINWSSRRVVITLKDRTTITADHVICTVALGVLKDRHPALFTPPLPANKINAINSIGFGTLGKVFLEFDQPFWSFDPNVFIGYAFLWTDDDLKAVLQSDRAWLIDLTSFVRVDGYPNLLEGLISGRRVREFENLSDTKIINDCMWLLRKFLNRNLPQPKSMNRTKWLTNRNFMGSYTYPSVDAERTKASSKDLARTLYNRADKPLVLFAGEATDETFPSFAHGAVSSGWRAANELVTYLDSE